MTMLSFINRRMFLKKLDRQVIRCVSTKDSYGLDNVKPPPVPDIVRKSPRLPFLKTIYAGQYDIEVLTYPETLNLERYKDLESRVEQIKHNCSKIDTVRQLGLFGMSVPYPTSGLNLTDTEIAKIFEYFDCNTFKIVLDHTLSVNIIKTFGTPNQKSKYLPLLANSAICSLHNNTVKATILPNKSWELSGTVKNSSSVFLLFTIDNKAFIVEKDKTYVNGDNLELKQTIVSTDDVIDNIDLTKILQSGKLYTCSLLVSSLRKVFQSTIMSVLPKSRINLKLREYDLVNKILGKSLLNIFTIESMIYLTTWMADGFDSPDIDLETAAIQLFVRETVNTTLNELKMLYGRNSIKEPFYTLCNDVVDLVESLDEKIELANYISHCGVEYFNKSQYQENISFITIAYRNMMFKRNNPSLKYGLRQFLHPSLMVLL